MRKIYLLLALSCLNFVAHAQLPMAYWSFEDGTHAAQSLAVTDQWTGTNGTAASSFSGVGGITTTMVNGAATLHGSASTGEAISSSGWPVAGPGAGATKYWLFTFTNTATAVTGTLTLTLDAMESGPLQFEILCSSTGGASWTQIATSTLTTSWASYSFTGVPTSTNAIAIAAWESTTNTFSIDNVMLLSTNLSAANVSFTTVDENDIYEMYTAGTLGAGQYSRGTFNTSTGVHLTINNTTPTSGVELATIGSNLALGSNSCIFFGNQGMITGLGSFGLGTSDTVYTANPQGLSAVGTASGSIQCTHGRNYVGPCNYVYDGTVAQQTGNGLYTGLSTPGGALTINNAAGVTLTSNCQINAGAGLYLVNGELNNSGANLSMEPTSFVDVDNGNLLSPAAVYSVIVVTYMDLGINAPTYTTGNEWPAVFTGTVTVNKPGDVVVLNSSKANTGPINILAGTLDANSTGNYNISLTGTWTNNSATGAFVPWLGTVSFNSGTISQTLTGTYSTNFYNLTVDNTTSTIPQLTLGNNEYVSNQLTLQAGLTSIGSNNLVLGTSSPPIILGGTPANGQFIIATGTGQLQKQMSANGSFTFPVGDAGAIATPGTDYTPITLNFTAGTYGGGAEVGVNVHAIEQPENTDLTNFTKRYWSVYLSAITSPLYNVTATYLSGDVMGTEANIDMGQWPEALPFIRFGATNVATHTLSTVSSVSNLNSDFTGIANGNPVAVITANSAVCVGGSEVLSGASSSGETSLTYTWAPAASLSASTGISVVATPTVITTYTLTVTDGNGFTNSTTWTVSLDPLPPAINGINFICGSNCVNLSDADAGGTWSSGSTTVVVAGTSGNVCGNATGTALITYTAPGGCTKDTIVLVNAVPAVGTISGPSCVDVDSSMTLSDAIEGWVVRTPMTTAMEGAALGVLYDNIYVMGGQNSGGCSSGVEIYNATNNAWSTGAAMPQCTYQGDGAGTINQTIYVPGGWIGGLPSSNLYVYSPLTNTWGTTLTIPYSLSAQGVTGVINNTLYFTTGANGFAGYANYLYSYTPSTSTWANLTGSNNAHASGAGGVIGGLFYVVGGFNAAGTVIPNLESYNPGTNTWTNLTSMPMAEYGMVAGVLNGLLYVVGGHDGSGNILDTMFIYNPGTNTWTSGPSSLQHAEVGGGAVANGALYFMGGDDGAGAITYNEYFTPYTWSSSNPLAATINSLTGVVYGVGNGSTVITFSSGSGCNASTTTTVNVLAPITGPVPAEVCVGLTVTLSDVTSGGTWTSSNANATVPAGSGVVTGAAGGTSTITYTIAGGCKQTDGVTVNANPATITGSMNVCAGLSTTLNSTTPGGTWTSSNTAVATVTGTSGTGVVTAALVGATSTATITYTLSTGCIATAIVTVYPLPNAITGNDIVCAGLTTTLSTTTGGGGWTSGSVGVATVTTGATTTTVNALSAGTSIITYKITATGCLTTSTVTVNIQPATLSGVLKVCVGAVTTLSDANTGGTWLASNANASVDGSGDVTGVAASTTSTITYTLSDNCFTTSVVTVNPNPNTLTGVDVVCNGLTTTLSSTTAGGTWSSANNTIASAGTTTGATSTITGEGVGVTTISYILATGCYTVSPMTVNTQPAPLSGVLKVCVGAVTTLSDANTGGTWLASANTTVDGSGDVTGVNGSTTSTITYTLSDNCFTTSVVTVNPNPNTLTGVDVVCNGLTTSLSSTTAGGTWSSASNTIASAGTTTGATSTITGAGVGVTTISYILATGCYTVSPMTVNTQPVAITGSLNVCVGLTTSLSDLTAGGNWTSSNGNVTAGTTGGATTIVTANIAGVSTVSYTLGDACFSTTIVTVNPNPAPITGVDAVCVGLTTSLSSTTLGGAWSSSNTNVSATTGTNTTIVTGIAAGTSTITYKLVTGCLDSVAVTVNGNPTVTAVTSLNVCIGATITLNSTPAGGTWTSSDAHATVVGATSVVTGVSTGTATMTYTLGTGCINTLVVTVNPNPATLTGVNVVCQGLTTSLSSTTLGGTWTDGADITGTSATNTIVVTGAIVGVTSITYELATGCYTVSPVTVNTSPATITGIPLVCTGSTTQLSDAVGGGTWTSSNVGVATVGSSTGLVTGETVAIPTTATITYTLGDACFTTQGVTVNPIPTNITGTLTVCTGLTTTLNSTPGGGIWSSSNTSVATISATGVVTGVLAGTSTITYFLGTGCINTAVVTVNTSPAAITGTETVCVGLTTSLSTTTIGGTWSSSTVAHGTVDGTGDVTGIASGTTTITFTATDACMATAVVTVNPNPNPITGVDAVCVGLTTSLSSTTAAGTWSSSNGDITMGTTGGATSIVTANIAGTSTVTYELATGCLASVVVTVNPNPNAITGIDVICVGLTTSLSSTTAAGTWSSSNGDVTAGTTGGATTIVTANIAGTSTVTYELATGCLATTVVTVNPNPNAITGVDAVCNGLTTSLSSTTAAGTWSSSNGDITVGTTGGATTIVTANIVGTSTVTYELITGCIATTVVTVNTQPAAITGTPAVCVGLTTALTDAGGGTWVSTVTAHGTVSTTGVVTGMAAGTTTISYTLSDGCFVTDAVTVNPNPNAITGVDAVCVGLTTSLSSTTAAGTWSSSNGDVTAGTTGGATTIVTANIAGTSTVTYELVTGCLATSIVTVNPNPNAITGADVVCVGLTTSLSSTTAAGTWSSSNGDVTAGTTGGATTIVTANIAGTSTVTYELATGCLATTIVTVNPNPNAITGIDSVCVGLTTSLSSTTAAGTWSSSNGDVAVGTTGGATTIVTADIAGTSTVTYELATGCLATTIVTVNPNPNPITGIDSVCVGLTTSLSSTTASGAWTSSATGVATAGTTTGATSSILGVSSGNSTITYKLTTGCLATSTVTVNPNPNPITGIDSVCVGLTTSLSSTTLGGTWSSSNTDIAYTNGSNTTTVTGDFSGTSTITYELTTGCIAKSIVTVNPNPNAITGIDSVCVGLTTSLSTTTAGGTWSSSNTSIATAGTTTGATSAITGVAAGTATITYTLITGCITTYGVTVNGDPSSITGTDSVCVGLTTTLNSTPAGGVWSSSNTNVNIGSSTGVVTGEFAGTSAISYTLFTGCSNPTSTIVTVNPNPNAITGIDSVCVGLTTSLSSTTAGGTWTSSNTTVATVGSHTGIVTGGTSGTATITYTLITGCIATYGVTVNPNPNAITGIDSVCVGLTTTLSSTTLGGTWSSSNTNGGLTTGSNTTVVTGEAGGTSIVTYTLITGCIATSIVTVNPNPNPITGKDTICVGLTTTLSTTTGSGVWSSSSTSIVTVGSGTGVITGIAAGSATITYTLITGCIATYGVTVNGNPTAITSTPICAGNMATLNSTPAGGTWTSSNTLVATVGSLTGIVTGGPGGTAIITYTLFTGCINSTVVTVNPNPNPITGIDSVCVGLTTSLSSTTATGTWSSSNGNIAIGTTSGATTIVTADIAGTSTVSYILPTGCFATTTVTVNPNPNPITGIDSVCVGLTTSLSSSTAGGTWSSSNTDVIAGTTTGIISIVTGEAAGTSTVTYKLITGCLATSIVTVNGNPNIITGADSVCVGLTTSLSTTTLGGTWSSSNTGIGVTNGSNTTLVTGETSGTSILTYTLITGCINTNIVTVNPNPGPITGSLSVCVGLTTTLNSTPAGGTWSSSNSHAFAGLTTGVITGVTAGTSTITYTLITGCINTAVVTVNPLPLAITGADSVCIGLTTALTDLGGGTWSASNTNASVGSTGVVTGDFAGTDVITYTLGTGCIETVTVNVNPLPVAITGTLQVCSGLTTTLSDGSTGGTWSSSNTAIATVGSATGVVMGGSVTVATTVTITYTLPTGCLITAIVTVNPLPGTISGTATVCVGLTTTLFDAGGGTWSLSNTNASMSGFVVTGVHAGMDTVTYTLPTGCIATIVVTVNTLPAAITGTLMLCPGLTSQLGDTSDGGAGTWTGGTTGIATISSTGVVTADTVFTASTTTVTYTLPTGCIMTAVVTVNPLPTAILGNLNVCSGLTTSLYDATGGGTWTSTTTSSATVGLLTGEVTGGLVASGTTDTTTIIYTVTSTTCYTTAVVTVNPLPSEIFGTLTVCSGLTTTLSDTTLVGTWTSSNTAIASVNLTTGVVTGVATAGGTATITYTLPTGCISTTIVTVNPLPGTITGTLVFCAGVTSTLNSTPAGGTWSSSDIYIATVDGTTGAVFGWSGGTVTITYTLPTGCYITTTVTVNPLPGAILGDLAVCNGLTTSLSDLTAGGTWSVASTTTASITSGGGLVTGLSADTTTVYYTLTATGCRSSAVLTVNPLPASITGITSVCLGLTTTLSDATGSGSWSSSDPGIASIGSATGIVTGNDTGSVIITYTLPTGCIMTTTVIVNPLPEAISGSLAVCVGLTTSLSDTGTGTWNMSNGNATIGATTGIVSGVNPGFDTVTYTVLTGCTATAIVTVYALPSAIYGDLAVCAGLTTALNDTPTGGTWSVSNGNASIGSTTGIVTGGAVSVTSYDTVTYNLATGCTSTAVVTVNPLPTVINGIMEVCLGDSTMLTDASGGGTWTSGNTSIATANLSTGYITGGEAGTATITYTLPTGCIATTIVTVTPHPDPIHGAANICLGLTTTLSDTSTGGIWTSSNTSIASVGSTGVIDGLHAGSATISYTLSAGCTVLYPVTVNPLPQVYSITPTSGHYCEGGSGVDIELNGSAVGTSYILNYYNSSSGYDSSVTGWIAGTGDTINFGQEYIAGTYTVLATVSATGCSDTMYGSAFITINPTVNPTVSITSLSGDTVCPGSTVTFVPSSTTSGASPTYKWYVNGVLVSLGATYTYIPANGDVVSVIMTSDAPCVSPATATDSLKMYVLPDGHPTVTLSIDPGDTVCQYGIATFTATATFGGTTPTFIWLVNNVVRGTGNIFSYYPTNNDIVYCKMVSDYQCRSTDTAYSNAAVMTVTPMIIPHVEILADPGLIITEGQKDSLWTIVTNAGASPTYQWEINGSPVPGATLSYFVSTFNNYDSVTCVVTTSGFCDGISTFDWVFVTVYPLGVQQLTMGNSDIALIPNPNQGAFTLRGTLGTTIDEEVTIEITDMLGQSIYRSKVMVTGGKMNEQIRLSSSLANGMYLLNLTSGSGNKAFHFVVEQ